MSKLEALYNFKSGKELLLCSAARPSIHGSASASKVEHQYCTFDGNLNMVLRFGISQVSKCRLK